MKREQLYGLAAAVASLAVGALAIWQFTAGMTSFTSESWRRAAVQSAPREIPDLLVQDEQSNFIRLTDMCGEVMVVNFIYTQCPTVCKGLGATSSQLARRFEAEGLDARSISLSFDPTKDTPTQMSAFKRAMEPNATKWQVARPMGEGALTQMTSAFGVVVIADGFGGYDHNAGLHVIDKQCKLTRILDAEDLDGAAAIVRSISSTKSM